MEKLKKLFPPAEWFLFSPSFLTLSTPLNPQVASYAF
jgi:hypothetical protein